MMLRTHTGHEVTHLHIPPENTAGLGPIDRLTLPGYRIAGSLTDASVQAPDLAGSVSPAIFERTVGLGGVFETSFLSASIGARAVPPGKSSSQIVIHEHGAVWLITASAIKGTIVQVASFAPLSRDVPEPTRLSSSWD